MERITFKSQPSVVTYSIKSLAEYVANGFVVLDAKYQRKMVWSANKQTLLISNIYRNMYINPVIVNRKDSNGGVSLVCIDGKQRLTSIGLFFANKIPVKIGNERVYYSAAQTSRSRAMTARERFDIENKNMSVVQYDNVDYETEKFVFCSLQNGVALSTGEKLNGVDTPVVMMAKQLRDEYLTEELVEILGGTRASDLLLCARVVLCARGDSSFTSGSSRVLLETKDNTAPLTEEEEARSHALMKRLVSFDRLLDGCVNAAILLCVINARPDDNDETIREIYKKTIELVRADGRTVNGASIKWAAQRLV